MKKLSIHNRLAVVGVGLALAAGLCLAAPAVAGAAPAASRPRVAPDASLGTFVPYWQTVQTSPGGCSGPVTPGYSISGPDECGTDSDGDGIVDFVYLFGGSSFSYTFTVPSGITAQVTFGIPAAKGLGNASPSFNGGYLNNSPATISVDGTPAGTFSKDIGHFGAQCQTIAPCTVWKSSPLGPGTHTLTVTAVRDDINLYGLWVNQGKG